MTLHAIVAALGGDLHQGGCRANVPAPGHSSSDRSVSLLLSEGRVVIHGFGAADWRLMLDWLRECGLVDAGGRLLMDVTSTPMPAVVRPDPMTRRDTALRLWEGGVPLAAGGISDHHLGHRCIDGGRRALSLRHHPAAPISVYRAGSRTRPALMARISDADGRLTAVELTYLEPNGRRAAGLRLSRKTVGHVPAGAAVRLAPAARDMLVGEGVATTLSAIDRFQLPGWALMSAHNLAAWTPPPGVRSVLVAADRGRVGEAAAATLRRRLTSGGLAVRVVWPDPPFGDWNDAVVAAARAERKEEGR